MIGHNPSGRTDTHYMWGRRLTELIREYHSVIVLQVYGHTHSDQFQVVSLFELLFNFNLS